MNKFFINECKPWEERASTGSFDRRMAKIWNYNNKDGHRLPAIRSKSGDKDSDPSVN